MKIHQLPEDLVARIAAGEVVERPAAVLKELIENSLDADATLIQVAIDGAGRSRISVSDDGCGMTREDARMALRRHATSKISQLEDLDRIGTFGFRGEALPSIAAVSRFRLTTRSAEEDSGWEFMVEGGKLLSEKPVAREPGTTIEVLDLFFNTPARFKFLKSDATEKAQCLKVLEEALFSSLAVGFEVRIDKARPAVFPAAKPKTVSELNEALNARLTEAWGARWSRGLLPVFAETPHFRVYGEITNQASHQATARTQFLYINRRPVQNRRLTRAIYDAYVGQLPSLRHPGWALFLDVDPSTVDVNVHPSKREVKLTHESEIYGFLNNAIRQALRGVVSAEEHPVRASVSAPVMERSSASTATPPPPPFVKKPIPPVARESIHQIYTPLELPSFEKPDETRRPELTDLRDPNLLVLAQIRKTYIVAQTESGLLIADQHAAAEKAAYERLMFNLKAAKRSVQMLLVPFMWEVSMSLKPQVEENLELFTRMGFVIEAFGGATFVIKGVPGNFPEKLDLTSLLDGLSDELSKPGAQLEHRMASMAACKASIKAGDALDPKACKDILLQLSFCEAPFTCPHGRPTVIRIPYDELDRRFRRN